jgi:hypothetical protein
MTKKRSEPFLGIKKKDLQFLVEEFLEKDRAFITEKFENQRKGAQATALRLDRLLFKDEFWMDRPDEEDHEGTDFLKALHNWHIALKPLWNQIKKAVFNYKEEVLPARATWEKIKQEPIPSEWEGLIPYEPSEMVDKYYDINLRSGAMSHVTLSCDAGKIDINNRDYKVKNNFLDLIKGVPISLFDRCRNCKKCIVITRKDKEHCPGCASKAIQKQKWKEDPDGLRKKERKRYRKKRKMQSLKSSRPRKSSAKQRILLQKKHRKTR